MKTHLVSTPIFILCFISLISACFGGIGLIFAGIALYKVHQKIKEAQQNELGFTGSLETMKVAKIAALISLVVNLIYFGYTAAETILLQVAGMSFFDAINHALCTLSTGGFSTKNASIAHWNGQPIIQYIIIVFMFLAGTNFVLSYFAFKGKIQKIIKDEEFKLYFKFIAIFTLIAALIIYFRADVSVSSITHPMVYGEGESAFRHALFQVLAIVTTTGFVTADYTLWTPFLMVFFFGLMFLGGSAGSTSGGVKVVRHLILIKNGFLEFKRSLHPNAILPVRYNTKSISGDIVFNILAFFILYMLSFIIGALVFSMFSSITAVL